VVGEDRPSPQRGAFAQLAACIIQDILRQDCSRHALGPRGQEQETAKLKWLCFLGFFVSLARGAGGGGGGGTWHLFIDTPDTQQPVSVSDRGT
jgi:hypothetical protein